MKFVDKTTMIKVVPETKVNVLDEAIGVLWFFKENPKFYTRFLSFVESGSITVDISNLQGETWDRLLRIKLNSDLSAYGAMQIVSLIVTHTQPREMIMLDKETVQFWFD